MSLAFQWVALLTVAVLLTLAIWLASARTPELLAALLAAALPATFAFAVLLYRHQRSSSVARRAVENLEARASDFFDAAMDPIVSIDDDQRVIQFNAAAERAFLWPRDAVLGQHIEMLIPTRFREAHREHLRRFASTGATSRRMGDVRALAALRANGEEFPIDASISQHLENGRKVLTAILRDATERERAKTQLATSEGRLRGVLDSAMDAIITVDEHQKIVLFNDAAQAMFGCPRDEAIGAPLAWFIPERFRQAHAAHVERFGATGVTARRMGDARVVTGLRRNGEEFPIDASISQLREGDAKLYTVILRDVSERVRTLENLARSREDLRELASASSTAREEEKARIARELHDEIAQSMSALKMDIGFARSALTGADPTLAKRLDRMEGQIVQTIASMRRIAADLRPLSLDDLGLVAAVEALAQSFERRSGVRVRLAVSDPDLRVAPRQATAVYRIVQESLTNIGKHANASGVDIAIAKGSDTVTVTVSDDGVGFSPDAARKPNSFGLLGIRERAYLLKGEASVASEPGRGTTITVILPLAET
ncbi:MAG TPA: PAS domain-containing sensor histidine kinase [Casimicrobiaceae bacterium]